MFPESRNNTKDLDAFMAVTFIPYKERDTLTNRIGIRDLGSLNMPQNLPQNFQKKITGVIFHKRNILRQYSTQKDSRESGKKSHFSHLHRLRWTSAE